MPNLGDTTTAKNELEFLRDLEKNGNLISLVSSNFTGNGDQITYTVPNGNRFYFIESKLYPITDTATIASTNSISPIVTNRRVLVSLTFDGVTKDILSYDQESRYNAVSSGNSSMSSSQTGNFQSTARGISLLGDGVKQVKLTSSSTSGTYRVSLLGWIE